MESFLQISAKQSKALGKMLFPDISEPFPFKILWFKSSHPLLKSNDCEAREHHHNFYEMHFYFEGRAEYVLKEKDIFIIDKNHFIFFPPNTPHKKTVSDENTLRFSLAYELPQKNESADESLNAFLRADEPFISLIPPDIKDVFMNIVAELDFPSQLTPIIIRNFLFNIIYRLCRQQKPVYKSLEKCELPQQNIDQRVRSSIRFINDNLDVPITALDVSNHVHISYKQLNRLFAEYMNTTVLKYIHNQKNERAKELLLSTDLSLADVSSAVGFENEYYFNAFFKQKNGISPGAFRKERASYSKKVE
ncbi:MAG: helix-turn-helix domain-containing protein [Clostridia bacterium]|nr:helix-turn-helix domain-containing protein [Clostridia bacterium]